MKPVTVEQVRDALLRNGITSTYSAVNARDDGSVLVRLFGPLLHAAGKALTDADVVHYAEDFGLPRIICTGIKEG